MSWKGVQRNSTVSSQPAVVPSGRGDTQYGLPGPSAAPVDGAHGSAHPVDAYSNPSPAPPSIHPPASPQPVTQSGTGTGTTEHFSHLPPPPTNMSGQDQINRHDSFVASGARSLPPPPMTSASYGHQTHSTYGAYGYQPSPYAHPGGGLNGNHPPPGVTPYGPGVWHDGGKIIGGPTAGIGIRYGLMAAHFSLLVVITVISAYYVRDIINLILHCCAALAFLIYIPAAFGITVSRRKNHFDHAAGELSYLVIQMCLWLGSGIWSTIYIAFSECTVLQRVYNSRTRTYSYLSVFDRVCRFGAAISGLSFAHFLILYGWMIWIIVLVYRATPGDPGRGFQVSTAWLLRGWNRGP